jgi:hypothetical protein
LCFVVQACKELVAKAMLKALSQTPERLFVSWQPQWIIRVSDVAGLRLHVVAWEM